MKHLKFLLLPVIGILLSCGSDDAMQPILQEEDFSTDLFFSEYVEGSSFNKALEIVNLTGRIVDLNAGGYSIRKQSNGTGEWMGELLLTGSLPHRNVYVIGNENAELSEIINNANILKTGAPMDFNGNDPIGLFKNGVLIDIIGNFNDPEDFGKDVTLIRKYDSTGPSEEFNPAGWETLEIDSVNNLGRY
ncbi:lamin tail domain-containing protein [Antarcticibacterium arcticum]|uniref:Lamin tail domain-containing protein n=1 Tax=Antarcticibacterium arcticum TaxID=2585771 RepID=A0A5B8YKV8_9FLAO|nr:lamin tail domain-containing protein [Antarcticibacterium arcticum]QED37263.1 lamin tail domain-containing protein [Antarcticibacterium arcticum]